MSALMASSQPLLQSAASASGRFLGRSGRTEDGWCRRRCGRPPSLSNYQPLEAVCRLSSLSSVRPDRLLLEIITTPAFQPARTAIFTQTHKNTGEIFSLFGVFFASQILNFQSHLPTLGAEWLGLDCCSGAAARLIQG